MSSGSETGFIAQETEVASKPRRRRFTAEYKRRILEEAAACTKPGEIGALLRREGLKGPAPEVRKPDAGPRRGPPTAPCPEQQPPLLRGTFPAFPAHMTTPPRQILPGTVYLVTRRCAQREFLLKPTELTTAIFKYVLAVAAERCGVLLHAACVLSNHYHLVLTDPRAALPRFCQLLDGLVARALNASYGRWESFWAPASYSAVELVTPDDVVEKIAYTLANPAAAGLVPNGRSWPGLWTPPVRIGGASELLARPDRFFSKTGSMPERSILTFSVPAAFDSPDAFRAAVGARLSRLERDAAEALAAKGKRFLGLRGVRAQRRTDRPSPGEPRRKLNPRIACKDEEKRREAIDRLEAFRAAYRAALQRLRSGVRRLPFPPGTYLLRVHLGVACAAA